MGHPYTSSSSNGCCCLLLFFHRVWASIEKGKKQLLKRWTGSSRNWLCCVGWCWWWRRGTQRGRRRKRCAVVDDFSFFPGWFLGINLFGPWNFLACLAIMWCHVQSQLQMLHVLVADTYNLSFHNWVLILFYHHTHDSDLWTKQVIWLGFGLRVCEVCWIHASRMLNFFQCSVDLFFTKCKRWLEVEISVKDLIEIVLTVDSKVHNGDCGALVYWVEVEWVHLKLHNGHCGDLDLWAQETSA